MRKLIVSNMVTVDGYFAGPGDEIDWHNVDAEFNDYAIPLLDSVDTLVFVRRTYQMMESWWSTPEALAGDPEVAGKMNALAKVVFSRTLDTLSWENARLVKGDIAAEMTALKQEDGKDMVIFGSGSVVAQLAERGVIDEYRVIVNPIALGEGRSQFAGMGRRLPLQLLGSKAFRSGNVLLTYAPRECVSSSPSRTEPNPPTPLRSGAGSASLWLASRCYAARAVVPRHRKGKQTLRPSNKVPPLLVGEGVRG